MKTKKMSSWSLLSQEVSRFESVIEFVLDVLDKPAPIILGLGLADHLGNIHGAQELRWSFYTLGDQKKKTIDKLDVEKFLTALNERVTEVEGEMDRRGETCTFIFEGVRKTSMGGYQLLWGS